jgi:4-hydroxy-tetrahydrodipicolinate reductase
MLKVAILGANGRMGRALVARLAESSSLELGGAVTIPSDPDIGRDAGECAGVAHAGVALTDDYQLALESAQVAIDFTLPTALEANLRACELAGCPVVIGTTGLGRRQLELVDKVSHEIPIVYGRNMSVGVSVFTELVAHASKVLGEEYDVEIVEAHHRNKLDAPSGTAIAIGERIAAGRGRELSDLAVYTRQGQTGPRVPGTIGFSVVRGGSIVGEHSVLFISPDERLEFTHEAIDRRTFASGALRAAQWLAGRAPGRYSMADVLGLHFDD